MIRRTIQGLFPTKLRFIAACGCVALLGCALAMTVLPVVAEETNTKKQEHKMHEMPVVHPPASFDLLKKLVGSWEGTHENLDGTSEPAAVTYRLTSAGTALVETLFPDKPHEMFSIYHGDRDGLVMTHYCALGNQPRLRLVKGDKPNVLRFEFADGTSMDSEKDAHMHGLTLTLIDDNRLRHEWAHYAGGKQTSVAKFEFKRRK